MTTTNNTASTIQSAEALRNVRSHARISRALVLALQDFTGTAEEKSKARAANAAATIGTKMLALKNALPSDPSKLRMHVESIKQKVQAIVSKLSDEATFHNHCQRAAISKAATVALENCDVFIAEYQALKAGNAATVSAAKVA